MQLIGKIFYGLFILLLLSVAGLFLATLLPIPGNVEIKIVKSGSMEPALQTGSIVVVRPASTYSVGDVITFGEERGEQIPTTHRIVSAHEESGQTYFTTKGDANEEQDNIRIALGDVVGKVVAHVPFAGYVLDFARKPLGFTFMIGIPAGIIIVDELLRIVAEVKRMRRGGLREQRGRREVQNFEIRET
jgi:signal peptidase I